MDPPRRRYRAYPWPWVQPSILVSTVEDERYWANYWLDTDLGEADDSSDLDEYIPSDSSGSSDGSSDDSDDETDDSASTISESELVDIITGQENWRRSPSPTSSEKALEDQEDLARQLETLVKAEQDASAAYNPDQIVSLITQLYELFIRMGHWPEGSLRYAPHTDPPVDETRAVELGYAPACIALMHRLPYLNWNENGDDRNQIIARSHFADYTREKDLKEGRRGWPLQYMEGSPDYDPWMLPIVISGREGIHVMLDTVLGTVRAWSTERSPPQDAVEWRRHGEVGDSQEERNRAEWTEYRRTSLVPAAHYFSEVIFAYQSLLRLPMIDPDNNDPMVKREHPPSARFGWMIAERQEQQQTLLTLYRECGWPDQWRRTEFVEKWKAANEEIDARARLAMNLEDGKRTRRSRKD